VRKRVLLYSGLISLMLVAFGCSGANNNGANDNGVSSALAPTSTVSPTQSPVTADSTSTVEESSVETATSPSGVKTETRTFKNHSRVSKVVVTTTPSGKKSARVYSNSGESRELPENKVSGALTATGDDLADAAGWVGDKSKDTYETSKKGTEKAVDKTVDVSKGVGEKTADVSKKVGEKTAEGAKTVGEKTAEGAKTVGEKTAEGAKKTGKAIKKAVTP
jgi:hypothetical protein